MLKIILISVVTGIVVAVACVAASRLLELDLGPASIGGITGGVTGAVVAGFARARR